MTFKEKLLQEHPEYESIIGKGCPCDYGYEKYFKCDKCVDYLCSLKKQDDENFPASSCWNREMPDSDPTLANPTSNTTLHQSILDELHQLYIRKNHDYGDSFHTTFEEEGWAMVRIRLGDKFRRLQSLSRGKAQMVNDESLRDTLVDLANYAILAVMEIDRKD